MIKLLSNSEAQVQSGCLDKAIKSNRADIVKLLIDAGADPKDVTVSFVKNEEIFNIMMGAEIDLNLAMQWSIKEGMLDRVKYLVALDKSLISNIDMAVQCKKVDIVLYLVERGASLDDPTLITPLY